jgi:hypothetical protein
MQQLCQSKNLTLKRSFIAMIMIMMIAVSFWFLLRVAHHYGPTSHHPFLMSLAPPFSFLRCSSILRSSLSSYESKAAAQSNIILVASHLRHGSDGQLRLRIIEHNLRLLMSRNEGREDGLLPGGTNNNLPPLEAILIFSIQDGDSANKIHTMVDEWRNHINTSSNPSTTVATATTAMITKVMYVPNDAILVDASKWMTALYDLLPQIRRTNARVMLMNDSFLLTRNTPELWKDECGDVCGLAWTAPITDPSRHIQSYIRTLSSCAVERYMDFYKRSKDNVHNVNELIVLFEINLDWARRGGGGGLRTLAIGGSSSSSSSSSNNNNNNRGRDRDVSAIYDYAGAHPDTDAAQKALLPLGYPAIKLKKFFVTDDPWLYMNETSRPELPPTFSAITYKKMNHDLNHLSDSDLEKHFKENGKNEDRIYSSTLPLIIKDWLREELIHMDGAAVDGRTRGEGHSTLAILEDYLTALNRDIIVRSIVGNEKIG